MKKENIFLKIITYGPLFFLPFIIGIILIITIQMYNESFNDNIKEIEKDLYAIEKKALETKIDNMTQIIAYRKSVIKRDLEFWVKDRVVRAYNTAIAIYEKYKHQKSEEEIKDIIKASLETSIWNDGESFIWMVDYNGVFFLAPSYLKHLEGTSIINFQDATGREVIKEEIAICQGEGEGFIYDTFTKPNGIKGKQYKQVVFVRALGHYKWYLGSGEYLDTATKASDKIVLETIRNIDAMGKHYVILMDTDANVLISKSSPKLVNNNLFDVADDRLKEVTKKLIDTLKNQDRVSLSYKIINPSTNKIEEKYTYFAKIANSDWIIGSGFYLSDIDNILFQKKIDLYDTFLSKSKSVIYIAIAAIMFSFLISYYISRNLRRSFHNYENDIEMQKNKLEELNVTLETKVKERTKELETIKDDFERLATTDALTSVHNRYSLMKLLSLEIHRAHRYNTPLSVMMLDIDLFKDVNDTYGHDVGDYILSTLTELIMKSLRDIDMMGRYGGEEFIIILPNTQLNDSNIYAERIRDTIDKHIFDTVGHVTVSIGLTQLNDNENIDKLFKRLDTLLYNSKHNGRNRVSS